MTLNIQILGQKRIVKYDVNLNHHLLNCAFMFVYFIALIHPIQWTIALPVGATGPAKRQKKSFCIKYRQDRSECTFARCRLVHTSCLVRMTS